MLEYVPETVYRVARHFTKAKLTIPIIYVKVGGQAGCWDPGPQSQGLWILLSSVGSLLLQICVALWRPRVPRPCLHNRHRRSLPSAGQATLRPDRIREAG